MQSAKASLYVKNTKSSKEAEEQKIAQGEWVILFNLIYFSD